MELKSYHIILIAVAIIAVQIAVLHWYIHQPLICPCGQVKLWGQLRTPEDSQMFFDWYSLMHISSGFFLYFVFFLMRKIFRWPSVKVAFLLLLLISFGWKIYENTNYVIYNDSPLYSTAVYQYHGDSLLDSTMDTLDAALGFGLAYYLPVWVSVSIAAIIEIVLGIVVHDSILIATMMTVYPTKWLASFQQAANYSP